MKRDRVRHDYNHLASTERKPPGPRVFFLLGMIVGSLICWTFADSILSLASLIPSLRFPQGFSAWFTVLCAWLAVLCAGGVVLEWVNSRQVPKTEGEAAHG